MKKIKRIVVKVVYEDDLSNDYNFLIVNKKITDRDQFREFKKEIMNNLIKEAKK
jgi:hypothetical protein